MRRDKGPLGSFRQIFHSLRQQFFTYLAQFSQSVSSGNSCRVIQIVKTEPLIFRGFFIFCATASVPCDTVNEKCATCDANSEIIRRMPEGERR
jgi:hypothetical protein